MAYLPGYSKYKVLTLTGGASGALTDHQLEIAVSYEAAMQGDFDDIRFTHADGVTLVDAWAELIVTDTSATVWVEFPTTPANTVEQTYYMYYGNAGVASDWDGSATFVQYHGAATANFLDSLSIPHNVSNIWEARIKPTASTHNIFWGMSNAASFGNDCSRVQSYSNGNTRYHVEQVSDGVNTIKSETPSFTNGQYYKAKIVFDGTTKKAYIDDNEIGSGGSSANIPDSSIGLAMYAASGTQAQDWSFVRKYAANPPTYEFGAEQSAPVAGHPTMKRWGGIPGMQYTGRRSW